MRGDAGVARGGPAATGEVLVGRQQCCLHSGNQSQITECYSSSTSLGWREGAAAGGLAGRGRAKKLPGAHRGGGRWEARKAAPLCAVPDCVARVDTLLTNLDWNAELNFEMPHLDCTSKEISIQSTIVPVRKSLVQWLTESRFGISKFGTRKTPKISFVFLRKKNFNVPGAWQ